MKYTYIAVPMKAEQENIRHYGIELHIRVLEIDLAVRSLTNKPSQELSIFSAL